MDLHNVLIIDHDLDTLGKLSRALKKMGYQVEVALDARSALEKLRESTNEFDLIFIEQQLPSFSGINLLKEIQSENYKSCVIFMSRKPDLQTIVSAMQEGAFSFIAKPISPRQLKEIVQKGIASRRALIKILEIDGRLKKTNSELKRQREKLRKEKLSLKKINHDLTLLNQLSLQINSTLDAHKMVEKVAGSKFNQLIVNDLVLFFYTLGQELFLTICSCTTPLKVETIEQLTREAIGEYERCCGKKLNGGDVQTRIIKLKCCHKTHPAKTLAVGDRTLFIPLRVAGNTLGMMGLGGTKKLSKNQRQLVSTIANQVAMALKNAAEHQKAQALAITDELTGVYNRRAFQRVLDRELRRSKRYQKPLSLIMLDVDGFKAINDTYGHEAGDNVLKTLASQLRSSIRDIDFLARYGGDEFAVILPETAAKEAAVLAERLKKKVSDQPVYIDNAYYTISVSTGVADITSDIVGNEHLLVRNADKVLYRSKQEGYRINSEL